MALSDFNSPQPDTAVQQDVVGSSDASMIGASEEMKRVLAQAQTAALNLVPVLISGEIGTGKSRIAEVIRQEAIRLEGSRKDAPFHRIRCGAEEPEVIDQQLFAKDGLVDATVGGTLVLEEVDQLSDSAQARLLQILTESTFRRPTSLEDVPADVRIIALTHVDLKKRVTDGSFRETLFWCLNILPIEIAPLRRRRDDIEPLTKLYLDTYSRSLNKEVTHTHPKAKQALLNYAFPGNVRELQNYLLRAVILAKSNELTVDLLPIAVTGSVRDLETAVFRPSDDEGLLREFVQSQLMKSESDETELFQKIVGPLEKELILQVLEACNQTQTKAAKRLGINRNTLYKKLVEFGLAKPKTGSKE